MRESTLRKYQLRGVGFYKWGCKCCGPADKEECRQAHKAGRRFLKSDMKREINEVLDSYSKDE